MLNHKLVTQAIESLLRKNLTGYIIQRNEERNNDPNICLQAGTGWIGIYRGSISYNAAVISSRPWLVDVNPIIEVQVASVLSGEDAEDRLQDAEKEVLDVLNANYTLDGTVSHTSGYSITYEYNNQEQIYYHSAAITINAEARA